MLEVDYGILDGSTVHGPPLLRKSKTFLLSRSVRVPLTGREWNYPNGGEDVSSVRKAVQTLEIGYRGSDWPEESF